MQLKQDEGRSWKFYWLEGGVRNTCVGKMEVGSTRAGLPKFYKLQKLQESQRKLGA